MPWMEGGKTGGGGSGRGEHGKDEEGEKIRNTREKNGLSRTNRMKKVREPQTTTASTLGITYNKDGENRVYFNFNFNFNLFQE